MTQRATLRSTESSVRFTASRRRRSSSPTHGQALNPATATRQSPDQVRALGTVDSGVRSAPLVNRGPVATICEAHGVHNASPTVLRRTSRTPSAQSAALITDFRPPLLDIPTACFAADGHRCAWSSGASSLVDRTRHIRCNSRQSRRSHADSSRDSPMW